MNRLSVVSELSRVAVVGDVFTVSVDGSVDFVAVSRRVFGGDVDEWVSGCVVERVSTQPARDATVTTPTYLRTRRRSISIGSNPCGKHFQAERNLSRGFGIREQLKPRKRMQRCTAPDEGLRAFQRDDGVMYRRRVLIGGATVLGTVATGCTSISDENTATSQESTSPETTVQGSSTTSATATTRSHQSAFQAFLNELGVTVYQLTSDPAVGTVELQYKTTKTQYEELGAEIGAISGGFFRQVTDGWNVTRLNAAIVQTGTDPDATWYAKTEWLTAYQNGELTSEELSLRVLETLEPIEDT